MKSQLSNKGTFQKAGPRADRKCLSSVWAIDASDYEREFAYLKTVVFLVFIGAGDDKCTQ